MRNQVNGRKSKSHSSEGGNDVMSLYLDEVGRYPLLSRDEEIELSLLSLTGMEAEKLLKKKPNSSDVKELQSCVEKGDAAREKLVTHNLRLSVRIAKGFQRSSIPLEDLVSAANDGLMHAARKYDATTGVPFGNYASTWIKQRLLKYTAEHGFETRIPPHRAAVIHRVQKVVSILMQKLDRPPTPEEIAEFTTYEVKQVEEVLRIIQSPIDLDSVIKDESAGVGISSYFGETPEEAQDRENVAITQIDLSRKIKDALKTLRPREAEVLTLYFGLDGQNPMDLEKIGKQMGFTRERARQIKAAGLAQLQESGVLADLHQEL